MDTEQADQMDTEQADRMDTEQAPDRWDSYSPAASDKNNQKEQKAAKKFYSRQGDEEQWGKSNSWTICGIKVAAGAFIRAYVLLAALEVCHCMIVQVRPPC